ncbi:MAG: hypothetical protein QM532_03485 [Cyanobium sp. MAG06]|nr:hypothetical protein [Cyanobium sp. MAG06]
MKTLRNKNKYYDLLMIMNNSKKRDGIKIYDKLEEIVLNLK